MHRGHRLAGPGWALRRSFLTPQRPAFRQSRAATRRLARCIDAAVRTIQRALMPPPPAVGFPPSPPSVGIPQHCKFAMGGNPLLGGGFARGMGRARDKPASSVKGLTVKKGRSVFICPARELRSTIPTTARQFVLRSHSACRLVFAPAEEQRPPARGVFAPRVFALTPARGTALKATARRRGTTPPSLAPMVRTHSENLNSVSPLGFCVPTFWLLRRGINAQTS